MMNKLELLGIDQDIYFEKLDNGLAVYILPFKNKNNYFVSYFTKFGSLILDFYSEEEKKMIHVPEGIAHFLEHKMFEQEDGVDPFEFFAKSGTGCNASTSYKATRYYCMGTENLHENLDYLINYVNSPYFTDENVEKEKGIICEEINMLKDNPEWFAEEEMQRMLYQKHSFRIPIAGSCESVRTITKEDLYSIDVIIPSEREIKEFENIVSMLDVEIKFKDKEISYLEELQSLLLAKMGK